MSLYVIGDLHLSFGADKPMDVFQGWEDYVGRLEENWRRKIRAADTVVLAGDISWGMTLSDALEDFRFIENLPGRKIILKGNHDYWFSTKTKVEAFLEEQGFSSISILFNNAFAFGEYALCGTRGWCNEQGAADQKVMLREAGRLRLSLEAGKKIGKEPIVFLHYPPMMQYSCSKELVDVMAAYGVRRCYYGHLHGRSCDYAFNGERDGILYTLISGDYIQFDPLVVT